MTDTPGTPHAQHPEPRHVSSLANHPDIRIVLPLFIRRLPEIVDQLHLLWHAGDASGLKAIAHQLRGSGRSYGFAEVTRLAAQLEDGLALGQPLEALQQPFQHLTDYLQAIDGYPTGPAT